MTGDLVPFSFKSKWLEKLAKIYIGRQDQRKEEEASIADELFVSPRDLAPVFIEPDLQPYNPADNVGKDADEIEDENDFRRPAFGFLEKFIRTRKTESDGRRHLFILADAGMGKSSILAMFKLGHANKFWPPGYECVPLKLGMTTLERVRGLKNCGNTVLLLDALDEDTVAFGRITDRISDLLKATSHFYRVIITCRNQFLPLGDAGFFPRQDRILIADFSCPVKYISPFDDKQIREYLEKRFPKTWKDFLNTKYIEKRKIAEEVVKHGDLRFRPMLLGYIEDLIAEEANGNQYIIYRTIVEKWLKRESRKKEIKSRDLLLGCMIAARKLQANNSRTLSSEDVRKMLVVHKELHQLQLTDIGGRSLLNKNSSGDFLFSHRSFQEFLSIYSIEYGFDAKIPINSGNSVMFFRSSLSSPALGLRSRSMRDYTGADFSGADLSHFDFNNLVLTDANFKNSNLEFSEFDRSKIGGADFSNANTDGVNFFGAHACDQTSFDQDALFRFFIQNNQVSYLLKSDFYHRGTNKRIRLKHATAEWTKISDKRISNTDFIYCDFEFLTLCGVFFRSCVMENTKFSGSLFVNCHFRDVFLSEVVFEQCLFWSYEESLAEIRSTVYRDCIFVSDDDMSHLALLADIPAGTNASIHFVTKHECIIALPKEKGRFVRISYKEFQEKLFNMFKESMSNIDIFDYLKELINQGSMR